MAGRVYDAKSFQAAGDAFKHAAVKAEQEYRRSMVIVGETTATVAKAIVAPYSKSIPPTVRLRVAGDKIALSGGSRAVPLGGLYELGNRDAPKDVRTRLAGGIFRHPVFNNPRVWVDQPMHPYLFRAYALTRTGVQNDLDRVLPSALQTEGIDIRRR